MSEAATSASTQVRGRTREKEQEHIDTLYGRGKMTRELWSRLTDELSEPTKWTKEGKR